LWLFHLIGDQVERDHDPLVALGTFRDHRTRGAALLAERRARYRSAAGHTVGFALAGRRCQGLHGIVEAVEFGSDACQARIKPSSKLIGVPLKVLKDSCVLPIPPYRHCRQALREFVVLFAQSSDGLPGSLQPVPGVGQFLIPP
jgi:hypothetical protein